MNIYFSCSITGGRKDERIYRAIVDYLIAEGHEIPTAGLADPDILIEEASITPEEVYLRDKAWVEGCQALIAEVSTPSHGVGYEIALALLLGKPVLCIYQQGRKVSKMITGNTYPTLWVKSYQEEDEAISLIRVFLNEYGQV